MSTHIPIRIPFDDQHRARAVCVPPEFAPEQALDALQLPSFQATVAVHGGAGNMEVELYDAVRELLVTGLAPLAQAHQWLIIDGATETGVAHILGAARAAIGGTYPLVGVMPHRRAQYPGGPENGTERLPLNPQHSHFIFVEGEDFGVESALFVGLLRASGAPGVALIINGGEIVYDEVKRHAAQDNTLIVVRGSGRIADKLADATSDEFRALPRHTRLHIVDVDRPDVLASLLETLLTGDA